MGMSKDEFLLEQEDRGYDAYDRMVHYRALSDKLQKENTELKSQLEALEAKLADARYKMSHVMRDMNQIIQRELIK